jgi:hypothetical protein
VDPTRPTAKSCPLASGQAASPSPGPARSTSAAASSKDDDFDEPGRLPSTRAPSRGPTGLAARVLVAFATASRIQRCFTAELPLCEGRACRLDPARFATLRRRVARTKRCSSTSATQTTREHNHGSNRSPCSELEACASHGLRQPNFRLVALSRVAVASFPVT